jgi:hypothetical protein
MNVIQHKTAGQASAQRKSSENTLGHMKAGSPAEKNRVNNRYSEDISVD